MNLLRIADMRAGAVRHAVLLDQAHKPIELFGLKAITDLAAVAETRPLPRDPSDRCAVRKCAAISSAREFPPSTDFEF